MAIKAFCTEKIRDKQGNIIAYVLTDINTGDQAQFTSEAVKENILRKKFDVVNLTLTSDNRLVDAGKNKLEDIKSDHDMHIKSCFRNFDEKCDTVISNILSMAKLSSHAYDYELNSSGDSNNIVMKFKRGLNVNAIVKYKTSATKLPKSDDYNHYFKLNIAFQLIGLTIHGRNIPVDAEVVTLESMGNEEFNLSLEGYYGSYVVTANISHMIKGALCESFSNRADATKRYAGSKLIEYIVIECNKTVGKLAPLCGINTPEEIEDFVNRKEKQKEILEKAGATGKIGAAFLLLAACIVSACCGGILTDLAGSSGIISAIGGAGVGSAIATSVGAKVGGTALLFGSYVPLYGARKVIDSVGVSSKKKKKEYKNIFDKFKRN